jgi:MFS family permease
MSKLYLFQAFLTFVKSLVGIFAPVYLYSQGFSFPNIILFIMGISITYLTIIPHSIKLINKIGFRYTILLSIPIYLAHITTLNYIQSTEYMIFISSFMYGLHMATFWPAMHLEISVNSDKKHGSSDLGTLQILITIFGGIAPLIGGTFLELLPFSKLLMLSFVIIFIGLIPLLFSKDIKLKNYNFNYKDYSRIANNQRFQKSKKPFFAEGIESFLSVSFWPIILFTLVNQNFIKLGILYTAASVISIGLIVYLKKYLDSHNKRTIVKRTAKSISFVWILRMLAILFTGFFIYIVEMMAKLIYSTYNLTFASIFYSNAKKNSAMDYIIFRELYLHGAKLLFGLIALISVIIFGSEQIVLSSFLIIGVINTLWLSKLREEI